MKKFKNLTSILFSSAIVISSLAAVTSCATTSNSVNGSNATKNSQGTDNGTTYTTVSFVRPTDAIFTYVGRTEIKVKVGLPFGTVTPPKVVCDGYQLDGWALTATPTTPISKTQLVTSAMSVVPILSPLPFELSITGDKVEYDGFYESHEYTLVGAEDAEEGEVTWRVADASGATITDALTLTAGSAVNKITAMPMHTAVAKTVYLCATYASIESKIQIDVKPPYYRSGNVLFENDDISVQVNVGNHYWINTTDDITGWGYDGWALATAETVCNETASIEMYVWDLATPMHGEQGRSDGTDIYSCDIYPGSALTEIDDYFLANVTHFNGKLRGGVDIYGSPKIIGTIGNSFLEGCINFNQDITDAFVFEESGMTIGDDFMLGCTSFNNGGEPLSLPTAQRYGDKFMGDCTALEQDIVIPSTVWSIGQLFMSGCTGITSVTFPATCKDLTSVGSYFMFGCNALEEIDFETETIGYFEELISQQADKGSFLKTITSTVEPEEDDLSTLIISGTATAVAQYMEQFGDVFEYTDNPVSGQINGYYRKSTNAPDADPFI